MIPNASGGNKVQNGYFWDKGHSQGHKVIDLRATWNGFTS